MKTTAFLALDFGAESGRAVVGRFDGVKLMIEEKHRFPNTPVRLPDGLHWDPLNLYDQVKQGIIAAVRDHKDELEGIGFDTWGVDYAYLDRDGKLCGNPYHYRDTRTDNIMAKVFEIVPRKEMYEITGIQFMQLNSIFQIYADVLARSQQMAVAQTLLFIPDLFNYWLTGRQCTERTIASTSQCVDPRSGSWATGMLEKLGIPTNILPEIIEPGQPLGDLLPHVATETGADRLQVIATGSHDTASAVVSVPAEQDQYAYLSSGTWSLMGVELKAPVITPEALAHNITNEGGVCGTIRFLKNIMGLWIIQECRRAWLLDGQDLSYDQLREMAEQAEPFQAFIDVDDKTFFAPGDMPNKVCEYCRKTNQPVPQNKGAILRVVNESLALTYRKILLSLETLVGYRSEVLHIVGGGSKNTLLNQLTANAIGRQVVTGPVEATAIGNILMQMLALKYIDTLEQGRAIVRHSFETLVYDPVETEAWDDAYARFANRQPDHCVIAP